MSTPKRALTNAPSVKPPQPPPLPQDSGARRLGGAMDLPIEQVVPDPQQPRRDWEQGRGEERLKELAASIAEFGVLQPLLVREEGTLADGRQQYMIIAGGRRYAAARGIGLPSLPVVVHQADTLRVRTLQLIENLQRQDLNPVDEARAYAELLQLGPYSPPELAKRLSVSAQHIRDRLRLLADQVLADAVNRGQISGRAARDIAQLPHEEMQGFRERIQAGERLQSNDVAAARARLAALGLSNPRLKRGERHQGAAPGHEGRKHDAEEPPDHAVGEPPSPTLPSTTDPAPAVATSPSTTQPGGSAGTDGREDTVDTRDLSIVRLIAGRGEHVSRSEVLAALQEDLDRLTARP